MSRNEQAIADAVERALRRLDHLTVTRHGHTVVARTDLGRGERVVIAGHLDTVPLNDNLPARREGDLLHGLGTCDMKGGDAVILRLAATVPAPNRDVTFILYDAEEIEDEFNGLRLLSQTNPELMVADFAILMEPSERRRRGGLPGHAARRRPYDGRAGPLPRAAGRGSTPSTAPPRSWPGSTPTSRGGR